MSKPSQPMLDKLVLSLIYHVYHRSELDPFLYDRKSNATYTFLRQLSVEHVHSILTGVGQAFLQLMLPLIDNGSVR